MKTIRAAEVAAEKGIERGSCSNREPEGILVIEKVCGIPEGVQMCRVLFTNGTSSFQTRYGPVDKEGTPRIYTGPSGNDFLSMKGWL